MNPRTVGDIIGGRYRLTEPIGSGGMGQIFKAVDLNLFQRTVALKLLTTHVTSQPDLQHKLRLRFEEEARVSALLGEHPRIIQVMDYGLEQDQPYLVMEYLGGPPQARHLGSLIKAQWGMDPERFLRMALQLCSGFEYAHRFRFSDGHGGTILGVIHRDIKPSNIFVINEPSLGETIKILDFGIAKVISDITIGLGTQAAFVGTPAYASPEQLRGEELDPRSDIYSLGVVFFEMLTGDSPISPKTNSFAGWYEAHNYQPPRRFDAFKLSYPISPAIQQAVMACLEKDPQRRPASMEHLAQLLQGSPQAAVATEFLTPPRPTPAGTNTNLKTVLLSSTLRQQLVTLLTGVIGPIAPILIQDLSSQYPDATELIHQLVSHLPPHQQASFRQQALNLLQNGSQGASLPKSQSIPTSLPTRTPTPGSLADQPLSPAVIQECQSHLTQVIGPMAGLVIQQVLSQTAPQSREHLIDHLAARIPDLKKAEEFRRRLGR